MQHEQAQKDLCEDKVDRAPLVAVHAPEEQVHVSPVDLPTLEARHQDVVDEQSDSGDGRKAQKQQRVDNQV